MMKCKKQQLEQNFDFGAVLKSIIGSYKNIIGSKGMGVKITLTQITIVSDKYILLLILCTLRRV